jgi:hypothetical protein
LACHLLGRANELSAGDKSFTAWGHHGVKAAERLCPNGKPRGPIGIDGRARASRTLCQPSFHRLFYLGRSPARLCRQDRGSRSTLIGAPIQFAPIA